jgi:pimeloyl-ACP methyl ester carboxylesterase
VTPAADLTVNVEGHGRPVLLLHGQPDSARVWRHVTPALVEGGRRVIAPDQRGCGTSPAPQHRAPYRLERITADVIEILDAHGAEQPVDVVGHDWGAVVGWSLCSGHPERLGRFVALSVGHPRAYARSGRQKINGAYVLSFLAICCCFRLVV